MVIKFYIYNGLLITCNHSKRNICGRVHEEKIMKGIAQYRSPRSCIESR